jgi:hypothetical protein
MKKKLRMTPAEFEAHQRHHGFIADVQPEAPDGRYKRLGAPAVCLQREGGQNAAQRLKMNATERDFESILQKRLLAGEILKFRVWGMRLSWGWDPETGEAMRYLPDFNVVELDHTITHIEVKGFVYPKDLIRFKGCRAEWPEFAFQMWQKKRGVWSKIH